MFQIVLFCPPRVHFESPNWSQNRSPEGSGTVLGAPGGVWESARGFLERSLSQLEPDVPLETLLGPFLEPSWSRLGALVGRSWAILSLPETLLGRSWGRLDASWGRLGTILGRFRAIFGPLGASMAL